jgi:hypothetical protein
MLVGDVVQHLSPLRSFPSAIEQLDISSDTHLPRFSGVFKHGRACHGPGGCFIQQTLLKRYSINTNAPKIDIYNNVTVSEHNHPRGVVACHRAHFHTETQSERAVGSHSWERGAFLLILAKHRKAWYSPNQTWSRKTWVVHASPMERWPNARIR